MRTKTASRLPQKPHAYDEKTKDIPAIRDAFAAPRTGARTFERISKSRANVEDELVGMRDLGTTSDNDTDKIDYPQ